jgi:trans-aconitate methyltransferase
MPEYNKYYQKRDYFGKPYPELLEYMDRFDRINKIIDLGSGQGRDVIALGRMGFTVMGIDISDVGINQLNEIARKENLSVTAAVMNYKTYSNISDYDIVLMNSMFHFYKNDIEEETNSLYWVLSEMKSNAKLILFVQESKSRVSLIKNILKGMDLKISIELEKSILYEEFNSRFYFFVIRKKE